jgi:curved DNA-binding protein CbpA
MDFDPKVNYYAKLGLKPLANKAEVKKKYYELVKLYHPDRNPNADQNKFKEMTAAYTVLSNEKTKHRYDSMRGHGTNQRPDPTSQYQNTYTRQEPRPGATNRGSSYYQTNYDNKNDYNRQGSYSSFYGYYKDSYGKYYNARDQYQSNQKQQDSQKQQYSQEAKKSYEKWNADRQKQRQQQEYEYAQAKKGRFYQDYEAFKRDYDTKFGDRESNYKQNFSSTNYSNARDKFNSEWSSTRGRPYDTELNKFNHLITKVIAFIF